MRKRMIFLCTVIFTSIIYIALNYNDKPILAAIKGDIPTIYVHGSSGTINSFGSMIERMEVDQQTKKELVLTVSSSGKITEKGKYTGENVNPSIQIVFQDNESTINNQVAWIEKCLLLLQNKYNINEVNYVGHSDGGIVGLTFLEKDGQNPIYPEIKKFVAIGSPFNSQIPLQEDETMDRVLVFGPEKQSKRYQDFVQNLDKVNQSLPILLIAGDVKGDDEGDEAVPLADAFSIYSSMKQQGDNVEKNVVYGSNAGHSDLHENSQVDKLVEDFLWN